MIARHHTDMMRLLAVRLALLNVAYWLVKVVKAY